MGDAPAPAGASTERTGAYRTPFALVILDGYGLADAGPGNAISLARKPGLDALFATYPWAPVECAGLAVGLPPGQMGNSEVGHLNMGAGRVVYQELTRISKAVEDGTLADNEVLAGAIDAAVSAGRAVHFMGLVSPGGVHSHSEHLYGLLRMAAARGAREVYVHAFLDGRDTPPESAAGYLADLQREIDAIGVGRIVSVIGRYYAMDRDRRWERVERAWRALVLGQGEAIADVQTAMAGTYARGVNDEFVEPMVLAGSAAEAGAPVGRIGDGDALVFFNFRPDRAREITRALVDPGFDQFERAKAPAVHFVCLTEYDPTIPAPVAFPKELPTRVLADVLADAGLRQLHIAETEKYAHVTFFLNGGAEEPKAGEERVLIPSPKEATYDLKPEMSAYEVTDALIEAIVAARADFYVVNYANCDMVGHTGVISAAVAAVEAVDACVGRVIEAIRSVGGEAIVTADHGNADRMLDADGSPFTAHTTDPVPLVVVSDRVAAVEPAGKLADVAPTIAALMGLEQPPEWTGHSLAVLGA